MKDCLVEAIRNNLELQIEGFNPKISDFDIQIARSAFDPIFTTSFSASEVETSTAQDNNLTNQNFKWDLGIAKKNILGGSVGFFYTMDYSKMYDIAPRPNRHWTQGVSLRISQPLLRGLGVSFNETDIQLAINEKDKAYYTFQNKAITVMSNVAIAYWNLVNRIANYELQRKSLELAENLYKITLARIKAGSLAAADILEAEGNVAYKHDNLIVAEKNIRDAEDMLKQLIRPLDVHYYKNVHLIPTEKYIFKEFYVDFDKALQEALEKRPDLQASKITLKNASLSTEKYKNLLLPSLNLNASIGLQGSEHSFTKSYEPLFDGDYLNWSVGVSLEVPIGNRTARSRYMQSLMRREQSVTGFKQMESAILAEVRIAVRELTTSMRRVNTAQRTRELAEKQLANEENKFRAGIIALYQVQDTEEDLTTARINESNALLDYQRALVKLAKAKGTYLEEIQKYGISLK
jgi:outer membrane protein TolC